MIVRDIAITLPALVPTTLITCSDPLSTAGSTTAAVNKGNTTADVLSSPTEGTLTTAFGRVIDRIGAPLGTLYSVAFPVATWTSTRGSTEANRKIQIGAYLLHGDSSGGGDMAEYSTEARQSDRVFFGTGRTSEMSNWDASLSTGALHAVSNPASYDIRAAKRYIQVAVRVAKNRITTESSGDEHARIGAYVTFLGGAVVPQPEPVTSPFSSSTST